MAGAANSAHGAAAACGPCRQASSNAGVCGMHVQPDASRCIKADSNVSFTHGHTCMLDMLPTNSLGVHELLPPQPNPTLKRAHLFG